jgi:hypothetical protein
LSNLVQAVIIIACQYNSATNLVVAQDVEVENPCLICPDGATVGDDYVPYPSTDPITCKEIIDNAKLFETGSLWCAEYGRAGMYCCPTTPDDPCTLCPNGITVADDINGSFGCTYDDGVTCSDELDFYANFDAESDTCTIGWGAHIESRCCPSTEANNPCIICPDGATAGEWIVLYAHESRTCKDIIKANLSFDAESEMCLVIAKEYEYHCCPSSTTEFDDYCNICPGGITAGDDFVPWSSDNFSPWSSGSTCYEFVQRAIVYENGSVGCNYCKGYEMSCCPGGGTGLENTLPETHTKQLYIVGFTAAIVGAVAALVGVAFAFARWKKYKSITSTIPAVSTLPNIVASSVPIVTATVVPQSTNVYNTPMLSQRNITLVN